jgi:hypothetical protein
VQCHRQIGSRLDGNPEPDLVHATGSKQPTLRLIHVCLLKNSLTLYQRHMLEGKLIIIFYFVVDQCGERSELPENFQRKSPMSN